jgi:hypothetical protein
VERSSAFCSDRFSRGTNWLERHLKFDEESLRLRLEKYESQKDVKEEWSNSWIQAKHLRTRLELKYELYDAQSVYVLKKVGSDIVGDFLQSAEKELFWSEAHEHLSEDLHLLWFLGEVGLRDNKYLLRELDEMIVRSQTVEGYIHSNEFDHVGPLRILVALNPDSDTLTNAIDYWLKNWKDTAQDPADLAVGILALTELDHERYSDYVLGQVAHLKSTQGNDGSWEGFSTPNVHATSFAIWAIAKVNGIEDCHAQGGLEWLVKQQQHNGSWGDNAEYTAYALTALLAMGEGPKISCELTENRLMRLKQELRKQKAVFVHTSPSYRGPHHVSEIHDKIPEMLRRAAKHIRITSPFIDMFYEELINLKEKNPRLTIKVISRPEAEAEGRRKGIAKGALSLLDQVAEGGVIRSKGVHARIIVIDECEALISSADLTRDQLIDEFNAGIYTRDGDIVRNAAAFFDNIFELERAKEIVSKT